MKGDEIENYNKKFLTSIKVNVKRKKNTEAALQH